MIDYRSSNDPALRGSCLFAARRVAGRDAVLVTAVATGLVFVGSGRFHHLDLALLGYLFATLVAIAAIAYRVSLFWRRPPSAFFGGVLATAVRDRRQWMVVATAAWRKIVAQTFVRNRHPRAWSAHLLLAWGTIVSFAVTLPLVFGWLRFDAIGPRMYRAIVIGLPAFSFSVDGTFAWFVFHALIVAAFAVALGAGSLLRRRLVSDRSDARAAFHVAPLIVLMAVALTGLALPVAGAFAPTAWNPWVSRAHELAVVAMLLALPFSKLFHIFMRPMHLGVSILRAGSPMASCSRCGEELSAPRPQLEAVSASLKQYGMAFGERIGVCGRCRRLELALVHDRNLEGRFH